MKRPRPSVLPRTGRHSRHGCSLVLGVLTCSALTSLAPAQVVLNEILADNQGAVLNGSGSPDFVELLNQSPEPVNLSGWSLSDDPAQPRRFVVPHGVMLAAGGRLMVWCDANLDAPGLHSGFGLGSSGETLILLAPDSLTPVDQVTFGLQAPNLAIGRLPDGTGPWTPARPSPLAPNVGQPMSDGSHLRLNEWMARPASGEDWLELHNPDDLPVALGGWVLTDQTRDNPNNRAIPDLSFIGAFGFRTFYASDLKSPEADHLDFQLSVNGETLTLYAPDRRTAVDRITFGAQADAVSQGRLPDGADTIATFSGGNATPGAANRRPIASIVINEVLSHSDPPLEDAIELHNPTDTPVDISGWWLSDSFSQPRKFSIPAGTVIPAGGYAVFYDYQFGAGPSGFSLNSYEGDNVIVSAVDADGQLTGQQDSVRFGALENGVSVGRIPTSSGTDFGPLQSRTFGIDQPRSLAEFRLGTGRTNGPPRLSPVVIHEIQFDPADPRAGSDEFIELHNPTGQLVPLFDPEAPNNTWKLGAAITLSLPFNVRVPPGAFVVLVGFDPATDPGRLNAFRDRYAVPPGTSIVGPWTGSLNNGGATLDLLVPDEPEGPEDPNAGFVPYVIHERIRYARSTPWPDLGTGSGGSLQRRDALAYGNDPLNWFAAPPTPGRPNLEVLDRDQDGLPDDWESRHGLDPGDSGDALADLDGDGLTNLAEFLAGTRPGDPLSVLRIASFTHTGNLGRIGFEAAAQRTYVVEVRSRVSGSEGWQSVASLPPSDTHGWREASFAIPDFEQGLLRLVVPDLP